MLVKVIIVFLLAMALLGMIGRWLYPNAPRLRKPAVCRDCGRPRIGRDPCPCSKDRP